MPGMQGGRQTPLTKLAGHGKRLLIVINHGGEARDVTLPVGVRLAQGDWKDRRIAAHGVAMFEMGK